VPAPETDHDVRSAAPMAASPPKDARAHEANFDRSR
jgi:hypothetical protein